LRQGEVCRKKRSVIRIEDDAGRQAKMARDEERMLRLRRDEVETEMRL